MYANYEDLRASEVPSPSSTNATHITIMPSAQQQQLEEQQQLPGRQDVPQPSGSGSGSAARAAGVPQYRGFKTCKNPFNPTIRYYIGNYKFGDKIKSERERKITIAILGIPAHFTLDL